MFRQLQNIDTAFRHVRLFSLIVIISCALVSSYTIYQSFQFVNEAEQRIFILVNGNVLEARASSRKDNIPVEAGKHIEDFHYYFFTLDPDERTIQDHITKALYLADHSAKVQYDNLKEARYYSNIISGNISQEITKDSVSVKTDQYPYYFHYYATQRIIRSSSILTRSLVTERYLRNVSRSENNSHGFLIERWATLQNKDISITNR
jgi:conjugative transposon TraK protein